MKSLFLIPCLLACSLFAGLDYDTTIRHVEYQRTHQRAGNIRWVVHNDNLATATAEQPIYINLALEAGAVLAETLVEQSGAPAVASPINLPLQLDGQPGVTVAAQADAMRIVRWVAGENSVWLEMRQSSNAWLTNGGDTFGPSFDNVVYFTIGLSARESDQLHMLGSNANLPFATRLSSAQEGDFAAAVSVLLNIDLRHSTQPGNGSVGSLMNPDMYYWESDAHLGGGVFKPGNPLACFVFTYDYAFARIMQRNCVQPSFQAGLPSLLPGPAGMMRSRSRLTASFSCINDFFNYSSPWAEGSRLRLRAQGHNVGFEANPQVGFAQGWDGYAQVRPETAFTVGGLTLYREAELIYLGPDRDTTHLDLDFDLEVIYPPSSQSQPAVEVETILLPWATASDSAPYDGAHQHATAEPQPYSFPRQTVALGGPTVPALTPLGLTALIAVLLLFGLKLGRRTA